MRVSLVLLVLAASLAFSCKKNDEEPPVEDAMVDDSGAVEAGKLDTRQIGDEPFGRLCDNPNSACKVKDSTGAKLTCVALTGGTYGKGYCARTCTYKVGSECFPVPNGQYADCFIEESHGDSGPSTYYCGFLCKTSKANYDCPATLRCGKTNSEGQALCVP